MASEATIDRASVVGHVIDAVVAVLNRESVQVTEHTRLIDELGLDSTNVLELLMHLEDRLDAMIDSDTLEQDHFETVGTLADYVLEQGLA
ncbi:acyl carrier protein [Actinoplanes hulinensis]|uniref:Acyl carrier protein n=2 Tax=Actinoplanes hulinensis TaxID=1144547 RepID=A0ABS7B810_9ACTN|nr:acyl carrier protein [Actinoplanes hulinensis]